MNQTISVTIPQYIVSQARSEVKKGYFSSLSTMVSAALAQFLHGTPTYRLSKPAQKRIIAAHNEYKAGKAFMLKTLDDLDSLT